MLARLGDADLIDYRVIAVGVETGDQSIPLAFEKLGLDAEILGDRLTDLHVEADELARGIMIGERRVGAFRTDLENACRLDLLKIGGGLCLGRQDCEGTDDEE